jgi:hypothetical protein
MDRCQAFDLRLVRKTISEDRLEEPFITGKKMYRDVCIGGFEWQRLSQNLYQHQKLY